MTEITSQPLLGTGLNGLVGSKFTQTFSSKYHFETLDVADPVHPVDITQLDQVMAVFESSAAQTVVHLAAFTDVNAAWAQRDDTSGPAYRVNVTGTENILKACEATGKHLIHISTAFVFDGQKPTQYTESDTPNAIEWYGQTKLLAEEVVQKSQASWTILRIDFPFRSDPSPRPDIARKTIESMRKGYSLFSNHTFGPTFIDDFVKIIDWVVRTKTKGLFHASSGETWSDYQLGQALNETLQLGLEVKEGNLDEYLKTLQRPYQRNTALDSSKLQSLLDFSLTPIAEAIKQVKL